MRYSNLQSFRQIYTKYTKEQSEKEDDDNSIRNERSKPTIILIATFYETIDNVKYDLSSFRRYVHLLSK